MLRDHCVKSRAKRNPAVCLNLVYRQVLAWIAFPASPLEHDHGLRCCLCLKCEQLRTLDQAGSRRLAAAGSVAHHAVASCNACAKSSSHYDCLLAQFRHHSAVHQVDVDSETAVVDWRSSSSVEALLLVDSRRLVASIRQRRSGRLRVR